MATLVSFHRPARRCEPGSDWVRRLDALGPVLLLAAVLAVLVAAAHESRSAVAAPLSLTSLQAE